MYFTLFEANTAKYLLELNKNGWLYVVLLWDQTSGELKVEYRFETKNYKEAEGVFLTKACNYNLSHLIKQVDNTDVYDYIESQHD